MDVYKIYQIFMMVAETLNRFDKTNEEIWVFLGEKLISKLAEEVGAKVVNLWITPGFGDRGSINAILEKNGRFVFIGLEDKSIVSKMGKIFYRIAESEKNFMKGENNIFEIGDDIRKLVEHVRKMLDFGEFWEEFVSFK
ncbi:MAG: hypothetical protein ACO2O4_02400 [Minisyncoccia bacterium]